MKINVKKTDRRHKCSDKFKYYVDVDYETFGQRISGPELLAEKFFELRVWCWETWGPGREADQYDTRPQAFFLDQNPHWSWLNDEHRQRLYLAGTDEAALFALKWS
jgi:hypothetical protein